MKNNYEDIMEEMKIKAKELYENPEGLEDLLESAKNYLDESDIVSSVMDDFKLSTLLVSDWMDGSYDGVAEESMLAAIISLLFVMDPLRIKPVSKLSSMGNMLVLGFLLKTIKVELDKYEEWRSGQISTDKFIELPLSE